MEKFGIGILGAARIAASALVPAIKKSRNAQLVAIAARDAARAAEFATTHGIPKHYGDYDAMLGDPNVHAVYNPLPNSQHAPLTIKALEAGKHVLCEKSFTLTAAEAEVVAAASARTGKHVIETFMYRFHPQYRLAQDIVQSGEIGELRLIRPSFSFTLDSPGDIRWVETLGGGALYDVGCYCVNVSRLFAGREPSLVKASADFTNANTPILGNAGGGNVDHAMTGILEFGPQASGANLRSVFDCAFSYPFRQRVELVGSAGTLVIAEPFLPDMRFGNIHGTNAPTVVVNGEERRALAGDQYQIMLEDFVDAAMQGHAPRFPVLDAVAQMRVLDALFAASKSGQPSKV